MACLGCGLVSLLTMMAAGGWAATYHVAQTPANASDTNSGREDEPWKTISKAAATVQAGDTVVVHAGTYREQVAVKTGGTTEKPIRFVAAPGEWVVLTSADRLTNWTKADTRE